MYSSAGPPLSVLLKDVFFGLTCSTSSPKLWSRLLIPDCLDSRNRFFYRLTPSQIPNFTARAARRERRGPAISPRSLSNRSEGV
ncbi:hypothetical protein AOLI_G00237330 [Acnodon oligacanthus]